MKEWMDKIWIWQGWPIVKYPVGILILWLVLSQIWYLETVKDYDKIVTNGVINLIKSIKIPSLELDNFPIFSKDTMLSD